MIIMRGGTFVDTFNFKTETGEGAFIGNRRFEIIFRRNNFIRRIDETNGLTYTVDSIVLTLTAAFTNLLKFSKVSYSLNELTENGPLQIHSGVYDIN